MVVAGRYQSYDLAKEASRNLSKEGYSNFIARAKDSLAVRLPFAEPQPQTTITEQQPQTTENEPSFLDYLQGLNSRNSRNSSMGHLLARWFPEKKIILKQRGIDTAGIFFREAANHYNLHVQPIATESDLHLIKNLNLPAIFTFYITGHTWPKYLAVTAY